MITNVWDRRGPTLHKGEVEGSRIHLLDVVAVAIGAAADPTLSTGVAPSARATLDTDGLLGSREKRGGDRLITVDADEVATQIMLPAERATARTLRANMGLQPVGIMSGHVSLQVVRSRES